VHEVLPVALHPAKTETPLGVAVRGPIEVPDGRPTGGIGADIEPAPLPLELTVNV